MALAGCGSPRSTVGRNAALDEAIADYVGGDLEHAEEFLTKITREGCADEDCVTAYLYLGRIYLDRGDYEKAADAFSAGEALGGDVRFTEYFEEAQSHLTTSPARIIQVPIIRRGQLAALIDEIFGSKLRRPFGAERKQPGADELEEATGATKLDEPTETGGVEQGIAIVLRAGVMAVLPDGDFHAEDEVTQPAFYAAVRRLANVIGARDDALAELFPGGYRGTLTHRVDDGHPPTRADEFVSGSEARRILDALAQSDGTGNSNK